MVRLDLDNAYARLGVSPLLPTDEIKEVINRKRKDVMRKRRTRGDQQFGEEEAEMTRLAGDRGRDRLAQGPAQYDRLNPQNALLTVQPARATSGSTPSTVPAWSRPGWSRSSAARASLPSPESLALWAPAGSIPIWSTSSPRVTAMIAARRVTTRRPRVPPGDRRPEPPRPRRSTRHARVRCAGAVRRRITRRMSPGGSSDG